MDSETLLSTYKGIALAKEEARLRLYLSYLVDVIAAILSSESGSLLDQLLTIPLKEKAIGLTPGAHELDLVFQDLRNPVLDTESRYHRWRNAIRLVGELQSRSALLGDRLPIPYVEFTIVADTWALHDGPEPERLSPWVRVTANQDRLLVEAEDASLALLITRALEPLQWHDFMSLNTREALLWRVVPYLKEQLRKMRISTGVISCSVPSTPD